MRRDTYQQCIEIIKAGRQFDTFNTNHLKSACGYHKLLSRRMLVILIDLGCVKYLGEMKKDGKGHAISHYQVTPYAITKLKQSIEKERQEKERQQAIKAKARLKAQPTAEPKKVDEIKKCEPESQFECGIKVVEKAYIGDMGNQSLKQLDQLLAGVRQ
ncbi:MULTISPECIES: hypothetical protein [Providencia]|uniref:Uncharacterized protein n=1 Tax=Providencia rettgeri TaxID=587 RepID=A0A9N8GZX0_PRORE|nr:MULTISPECIES: hypothetical protein [Providencia]CAB5658437.1 Uncharacterised protein [Providencia rettgeri]CAB5674365.1 Uncharacterised protein [Providencia rettgeri]CAC9242932.1 Uncharacterised protein [Providencia rettgeri]CAC9248229.1 Uncharacterised protein [Providencia rettgeri]